MRFLSKHSSFNIAATNVADNGYVADTHDFEVLPNGHALIMSYDSQYLDLSTVVSGGYPAARVDQTVIQEVDVDNNAVFQWRSLDHIPVTNTYKPISKGLDYIHVISIWFDELDGSIIASCRETSGVIKISRVTGEIIWRLQGKHNQFAFSNVISVIVTDSGTPSLTATQTFHVIVYPIPSISVSFPGGQLQLSWPFGTLQKADEVTGPYCDLTDVSPFTPPMNAVRKFYRIRF